MMDKGKRTVIVKTTVREQVVNVLRKQILSGEITQGERIIEADVAAELQVSRGTIREALRQIEEEGLITYIPHRGCIVKTLSYEDMQEQYLIRSTLEILAVKIYSGKMSREMIERMEEIEKRIEEAGLKRDLYEVTIADEEFHSCIVEEAGRDRLYRIWKSLEGSNAATYYTMDKETLMPFNFIGRNHKYILDTIKKGDMEEICNVIEEHYMVVPKELYKKKQQ